MYQELKWDLKTKIYEKIKKLRILNLPEKTCKLATTISLAQIR